VEKNLKLENLFGTDCLQLDCSGIRRTPVIIRRDLKPSVNLMHNLKKVLLYNRLDESAQTRCYNFLSMAKNWKGSYFIQEREMFLKLYANVVENNEKVCIAQKIPDASPLVCRFNQRNGKLIAHLKLMIITLQNLK